jgi:hypothetical protein
LLQLLVILWAILGVVILQQRSAIAAQSAMEILQTVDLPWFLLHSAMRHAELARLLHIRIQSDTRL